MPHVCVCEREPTPIALLYDDILRCWEIVFRINLGQNHRLEEPMAAPDEYDELQWREPSDLPEDLTPIARQMIPLMKSVLG